MFLIKQVITVLVLPTTVALALIAAGGLVAWRGRAKAARTLFVCGALLAYLASVPIVGNFLLLPLEAQYAAVPDGSVPPAAFVVVLGSSYVPRDDAPLTAAIDREGLVRIVEGIRLARKVPSATLVVSGGAPPGSVPSALGYAELARELGVSGDAMIVIDTPLDTTAEARAVVDRVGQAPFLLVTSAYHMPRAMRRMEAAGARPIPAPTGQLASPSLRLSPRDFLPASAGLSKSERAVREYVGLLALALGFD